MELILLYYLYEFNGYIKKKRKNILVYSRIEVL